MGEGCITVERYLFSKHVYAINCELHGCELRFKSNRPDLERAIFKHLVFRHLFFCHLKVNNKSGNS